MEKVSTNGELEEKEVVGGDVVFNPEQQKTIIPPKGSLAITMASELREGEFIEPVLEGEGYIKPEDKKRLLENKNKPELRKEEADEELEI